MLPTFVIGLREGLEAALIVGIIAAFLRKQNRRDLLRWVFLGVGTAIALCVAAGVALHEFSKDLPQAQQEGLETVIGVLAVGMVTYMVVWMKRHSRELKGQLEGMAAEAMDGSSRAGRAMVLMAFLAVLREGVETVVFLLAAFNESGSGANAPLGAVLGILLAVVLGYGLYRGGVKINLSKFFRATGLVLVLVAAGLVVNALHTAHEAGWLNAGQGSTIDLSWLVRPGSVQSSLLTGMLGLQPHPVVVEVIGWLVYLVPVGCFVAWPPGKGMARRTVSRVLLATGAVLALATVLLAVLAPSAPTVHPVTTAGGVTAQLVPSGHTSVLRTTQRAPIAKITGAVAGDRADGAVQAIPVTRTGSAVHGGQFADVYSAHVPGTAAATLPKTVGLDRLSALNGGHLPIGLPTSGGVHGATLTYRDTLTVTAWVEPDSGRVLDVRWAEQVTATARTTGATTVALAAPVAAGSVGFPAAAVHAAAAAAGADRATINDRDLVDDLAWTTGVLALVTVLGGSAFAVGARRQRPAAEAPATPVGALVRS